MISLERLKQRKLFQWAAAYLAAGWVVLQLIDVVGGYYSWPALVGKLAIVVLVAGFLLTLVLAWYHGEQGRQRISGVELLIVAGVLTIAGVLLVGVTRRNATSTGEPPAAADEPAQGSIAVLPFVNMSDRADQEFFSDGLTEELLNVLANIPELHVAARTSSFAFKGKNVPIDSIARALKVLNVVEGSVRTAGARVRITAQLVNARNGYQLWSSTYNRELKDVFELQDEISRAIVAALRVKLMRTDATLARRETSDTSAHLAYLRGLAEQQKSSKEGLNAALREYRFAIERDPNYARAYAAIGDTYGQLLARNFIGREEGLAQASAAATRALALDSTMAVAYSVLGEIALHQGDAARAEAEFRRGIQYGQGSVMPRLLYAYFLRTTGRLDESERQYRAITDVDPLNVRALGSLAYSFFYQRRYQEAEVQARHTLSLQPDYQLVRWLLGRALAELGRVSEGARLIDEVRVHEQDPDLFFDLAAVYARAGDRARALANLKAGRDAKANAPILEACAMISLGDLDAGLAKFEAGARELPQAAAYYSAEPCFDAVRDRPSFRSVLTRLGVRHS